MKPSLAICCLLLPGALAPACREDAPEAEPPAKEQPVPAPRAEKAGEARALPPLPDDPALIGARELLALLKSPDTSATVVDARNEREFAAVHVQGAVHVPVFALDKSAAVRAGQVIIVGAGFGDARLASVVQKLRGEGRPVRILDGGIQAWCRVGGGVLGRCIEADVISPARYRAAQDCGDRAVVVALPAGGEDNGELREMAGRFLPGAAVIEWREPAEVVAAAREATKGKGARLVTVIDGDGSVYGQLRGALGRGLDRHVFFLEGGVRAYRALEEMQHAMRSHKRMVNVAPRPGAGSRGGRASDIAVEEGCGCL